MQNARSDDGRYSCSIIVFVSAIIYSVYVLLFRLFSYVYNILVDWLRGIFGNFIKVKSDLIKSPLSSNFKLWRCV